MKTKKSLKQKKKKKHKNKKRPKASRAGFASDELFYQCGNIWTVATEYRWFFILARRLAGKYNTTWLIMKTETYD